MPPDNSQPQMMPPAGQPVAGFDATQMTAQYATQPAQAVQQQVMQPTAQAMGSGETDAKDNGKQTAQTNKSTTQKSLLFSELRDSMIIMSDGSFRSVVACESINFDLMSSREREGVEYSYQNFLNSLSFPVQIFIRSQRVDIAPYLERLAGMRRSQDNMLLGVLMDDYIDFVAALAEEANIMDKSFYIAIPYYPEGDATKLVEQSKGFFSKIFGNPGTGVTKIDQTTYEKAKDEMKNRVDSVMSGLYQLGVQCMRLDTKELGKLYYSVYNPDTSINQPLSNFEQGVTSYVRKGDGDVINMPNGQGDAL